MGKVGLNHTLNNLAIFAKQTNNESQISFRDHAGQNIRLAFANALLREYVYILTEYDERVRVDHPSEKIDYLLFSRSKKIKDKIRKILEYQRERFDYLISLEEDLMDTIKKTDVR